MLPLTLRERCKSQGKPKVKANMFTWIPIHREAIHRILQYRQNQMELLTILREMEQQDLTVISLWDEGADGQNIPLAEIDPFTFLASFNRGVTDKNRQVNWNFLKMRWGLKALVPDDFMGIPLMFNMNSWFFPYATNREKDHVGHLWQVASLAADGDIEKVDAELFDRCLRLRRVGIASLTIGLFWINPEIFLPADHKTTDYGKAKGITTNRILKATMRRLIRTQGLATECSEGLAQLCRLFSDIQDIELTNRVFGQVQLYRNNQFYDFLLKVCELIHRNLLVSEKSGTSKFKDFIQDERQMAVLFENFVRTFYRIHTDYRVKREDIYWRWIAADQVAAGLLPKMQTDISLTSDARKIIIDCKYTPEATKQHYEALKLRRNDLFQINAYMDNLQGEWADNCEMMLLYPTVDSPLSANYTHKNHKIHIRTVNLNQPWQQIHGDLLTLVE